MSDIQSKVERREYRSPSYARGALARSSLPTKDKKRLAALIDAWENEGTVDHVVAGEPAEATDGAPRAPRVELVDSSEVPPKSSYLTVRAAAFRLNLSARVRVRLTIAGLSTLHAARSTVHVPGDILDRGGVWETELWQLAAVIGPHLYNGILPDDALIAGNLVEVLDPLERQ